MAKTSAIQKNLKRIKLVKKYANKRAALKKIIMNKKLELSAIMVHFGNIWQEIQLSLYSCGICFTRTGPDPKFISLSFA